MKLRSKGFKYIHSLPQISVLLLGTNNWNISLSAIFKFQSWKNMHCIQGNFFNFPDCIYLQSVSIILYLMLACSFMIFWWYLTVDKTPLDTMIFKLWRKWPIKDYFRRGGEFCLSCLRGNWGRIWAWEVLIYKYPSQIFKVQRNKIWEIARSDFRCLVLQL